MIKLSLGQIRSDEDLLLPAHALDNDSWAFSIPKPLTALSCAPLDNHIGSRKRCGQKRNWRAAKRGWRNCCTCRCMHAYYQVRHPLKRTELVTSLTLMLSNDPAWWQPPSAPTASSPTIWYLHHRQPPSQKLLERDSSPHEQRALAERLRIHKAPQHLVPHEPRGFPGRREVLSNSILSMKNTKSREGKCLCPRARNW